MTSEQRKQLSEIKQFKQLIAYLRDEMGWPIKSDSKFDELTYEYTATELGIDDKSAAEIQEIKRLRPLSAKQPWGVFFVKFEPKKLPVAALRRILGKVALKKRASANPADRTMWAQEDLLFISNYGEGDDRQITLAHFSAPTGGHTLPSLKVLGWDSKDTVLHLEAVARELTEQLSWPDDESDVDAWRAKWRAAFTVGHQEVITTSKALATRLAQLARDIRDRISTALAIETENGPLTKLMKAFQESLIHDLTPDDFADMYAQTIAYGLLSSRIADPKKQSVDDLAAHMRLSPFLKELMETFLLVGGRQKGSGLDFDELGVSEVVSLLDHANMEAVVADFGNKNPQEDPVIHFYELFLKEYDAKTRMSRGVFYTPRPVVSYIVNSIDSALRTEFGLADGLADITTWGEIAGRDKNITIPPGVSPEEHFVQILDPATGTGTFLVEVIDVVYKALLAKWSRQGHSPKTIATMWNAYVSKHLLSRLHGYEIMMASYAIGHLKIGLKLYETGYLFKGDERAKLFLTNSLELPLNEEGKFDFSIPALAHEAAAVNAVKRAGAFTVVLGNPPYSSVSQNMSSVYAARVREYMRLADGAMKERGRRNHLQDDYVKFFRMSQETLQKTGHGILGFISNSSYLEGTWFRGMRLSLQETFSQIRILDLHGEGGFHANLDKSDQNVFDIQQGVAIGIFVQNAAATPTADYAELTGSRESKFARLINPTQLKFERIFPLPENTWLLKPFTASHTAEWSSGFPLSETFTTWGAGAITSRDNLAIAFTPTELKRQISDFLGNELSDAELEAKYKFGSNYVWNTGQARAKLRNAGFSESKIRRYLYRPFDVRYIYWDTNVVFNMRGNKLQPLEEENSNWAFMFGRNTSKDLYTNFFVTEHLADRGALESANVAIIESNSGKRDGELFGLDTQVFTRDFIAWVGHNWPFPVDDHKSIVPYMYALFFSQTYRVKFASQLRIDYPRILAPNSEALFTELVSLGEELIALHKMECIPNTETFQWTALQKRTEIASPTWSDGTVWVDSDSRVGLTGVSKEVWEFMIGGHKICEKWIKNRKGRLLTEDVRTEYQAIVTAISESIKASEKIEQAIDDNGSWPGAFQTTLYR
jgi:predicted helicase